MKKRIALSLSLMLAAPALAGPRAKPGLPADAAALVRAGKRPGFFDPKNLARPPVLSAPSWVLMDFDTGEILAQQNAETRRFPASTTKILTALLFVENTQPDDIVKCDDAYIEQIGESTLHIKPGETFTAQDLTYGLLLRSGNDAGAVIAEHVAGSVHDFAHMMNERAAALGAVHSHFVNPHGLHDPQHFTTAGDLARITRAALQNPRFADAVRTPRRTIQRSINRADTVITAKSKPLFYDRFPGADGVKTGYTRPAGHCFVGSATRDGRRLIAVAMGAPHSACSDAIPLLSWGFQRFESIAVAAKDSSVGTVPIRGGAAARVTAEAVGDLKIVRDRTHPERIEAQLLPTRTVAPIEKGQIVGRLVARLGGREVGSIPLRAAQSVALAPVQAAAVLPALWLLGVGGGAGLLLVRYRHGTAAKNARRRRDRVPSEGGGDDRRGQG